MTRRCAAPLALTLALTWVAAPALAAPGDPVTGYWSRTRTGLPVPVEPPEPVPEGGTFVASDPLGPVAVSALRSVLAEGLEAVELRLKVADAIGAPAVQVCPTLDRWAPEQGGRLEGAPEADCEAPIEARIEEEVLIVPLPPGLDVVDVLLRPAPGSAFSLTMERATADSVVTMEKPSEEPFTPSDPGPAAPPPAFTAPPPATSGFAPTAPLAAPVEPAPMEAAASEPLLAAPDLPPAEEPLAGPAPETAAVPGAAPGQPVPVAAPLPLLPENGNVRLLATALLTALGALAVGLAREPARAPQALGGAARRSRPAGADVPGVPVVAPATAAPAARGLGRFRSARTTPPVRL